MSLCTDSIGKGLKAVLFFLQHTDWVGAACSSVAQMIYA